MKTALKWIGWSVLALIAASIFFNLDKTAQTVIVLVGLGYWAFNEVSKEQAQIRKAMNDRMDRFESRLNEILDSQIHPSRVEALEEMADEYRARKRALARSPHEP